MSEQLFQIGIKALIRDQQGKLLIIGFQWPDNPAWLWDLPGGRMEPDETFEETLRRELHEELGIASVYEARQLLSVVTNHTIETNSGEVGLACVTYEVTLPAGVTPIAAEDGSIIKWVDPIEAADRLHAKFPSEFCAYITKL